MHGWILDACTGTIALDLGLELGRDALEIDLRLCFSPIDIERRVIEH